MTTHAKQQLLSGVRITSLATLASRVLGMVRDMATAALFGLAAGGVMDALVVALRIPNLFRRMFGEGAFAASYLPVLTAQLDTDRQAAWRLASVAFSWLAAVLVAVVLLGQLVCLWAYGLWGDDPQAKLLITLSATLLPYMIFICLAAQAAATLHALSHFTMPALAPVMLNLCWLIAVWGVVPWVTDDKHAQAHVLAACILVAGLLQFVMQLPPLWRQGFRFDYDFSAARDSLREVCQTMLPTMLGLAVTQVNTMLDSLLAWGLAAPGPAATLSLGAWGSVSYPMRQGAAAAVYYGERLYQFPLGILGVTVATVIYPLLSRHAARGNHRRLANDLTLGLRLVCFLALPATVGLMLLGTPIARLLFERGEFTANDALRTGRMITWYAAGVWAYCALPVLVRGYYSLGDHRTPVRIGLIAVGLNLGLNLILVWPLGELALALSTAAAAGLQAILLAWLFSRRAGSLGWTALGRTIFQTGCNTAAMAAGCLGVGRLVEFNSASTSGRLLAVVVPLLVGGVVYLSAAALIRSRELQLLLRRK